jgi:hypothetical protein
MLVQSRINRIIVAAAGAFAMTAPLAGAMPVEGPLTTTPVEAAGAQRAMVLDSPSDAAQRSAGETNGVQRSSDRSDAAQIVPGAPLDGVIRVTHPVPQPSDVPAAPADDGFGWEPVAIGGSLVALLLAGGGTLALTSRRQRVTHA